MMGFGKHRFSHRLAHLLASLVYVCTLSGCSSLLPSKSSSGINDVAASKRSSDSSNVTASSSAVLSTNASPRPASNPVEVTQRSMIAILPLNSPTFKEVANSVRAGIQAGAERASTPELRWQVQFIQTDDNVQESTDAFANAQISQAVAVLGPLTRNAVNAALNISITKPTVLLNLPPPGVVTQGPVLAFSLSLEAQARFLADAAWSEAAPRVALFSQGQAAKPRALILQNKASSAQSLSRRTANGFAQQFVLKGGEVEFLEVSLTTAARLSEQLKPDSIDTVFMALEAPLARAVRPFLPRDLPVWGTSELNTGQITEMNELEGLHFTDMPWLLRLDDLAVMAYPRPDLTAENMRWYAFGIDAFRLALELSTGKQNVELDGVTGRLRANATHRGIVERIPILASIKNGKALADPGQ
ncbi:MAG: penicillin-binding protein activator [Burkholderiaceae bacterium]|nr:penicillin-binding protein activator [Burkholderiaceae bacterium]